MAGGLSVRLPWGRRCSNCWLDRRDTIEYAPFPRFPWLRRCPKRRAIRVCGGYRGRELMVVSRIIERLAVEHGDAENLRSLIGEVYPCGQGAQEELR